MKTLQHIGEAALFGAFVVGLGMLICLFIDASLAWSPLFGALGVVGLVRAGDQM